MAANAAATVRAARSVSGLRNARGVRQGAADEFEQLAGRLAVFRFDPIL